jgi:NAD(P)-dependent dehydrogenase (short-subunit alcohol dehydrogenase family)
MKQRFSSRIALVTGAGSGVGRATALRLSQEGATVALLGRRSEPLDAVAAEIDGQGGRAIAIAADVSNETQVVAAVRTVERQLGGLDLLVNAAGVLKVGAVTQQSVSDWDAMFGTNAKGCFLTSRAAIPLMSRNGGAIVNVSSVFAYAAGKSSAVYAASKAAVVALTRTMALDHLQQGVRINGVAPGSMATPMLQAVAEQTVPNNPSSVLQAVGRMHPIRRLVEPAEVAGVIAFLLSDEASAIVGATYVVDGGRLAILGSAE